MLLTTRDRFERPGSCASANGLLFAKSVLEVRNLAVTADSVGPKKVGEKGKLDVEAIRKLASGREA